MVAPIIANQDAADPLIYVPFVAHIRIIPDCRTGKRIELIRNLQKIARFVEEDLVEDGWNIATPIAYTPQIGDSMARLTIVGFRDRSYVDDDRHTEAPTTNINLIHSGTDPGERTATISGNQGGSLSYGQDTTSTVDAEVKQLRLDLVASSSRWHFTLVDVIHIEYNGVKYGVKKQGGRSFPR